MRGEEAMIEDATVADRVVAILTQRLGISPEAVAPTAELAEDLGIDSVDAVELALALDREFNVTLPDGIIAEVRTVQDVVDFVCQRTAPREMARA
jgi:acyl carrier protein